MARIVEHFTAAKHIIMGPYCFLNADLYRRYICCTCTCSPEAITNFLQPHCSTQKRLIFLGSRKYHNNCIPIISVPEYYDNNLLLRKFLSTEKMFVLYFPLLLLKPITRTSFSTINFCTKMLLYSLCSKFGVCSTSLCYVYGKYVIIGTF